MWGLDFLALAKYPDVALREFPKGFALGCFANTFGDALPAVEKIVASGRCPLVRVQLLWSDTHFFSLADIPKAQEEARRYERLAVKYPKTRFYLSPFCEHNIPNPDSFLDLVAPNAPSCSIINSPFKGANSAKYKNEHHGIGPRPKGPYTYSYDGTSAVDDDVMARKRQHRRSEVFFFWVPQFNLRKKTKDPTPRADRKAVPTSDLIDSLIYLKGNAGVGIKLPPNYLWKSHADQHTAPVPEFRASKPVLICPLKAERFELVASNGQVVGILPYSGPFADGRHRYYLGSFGYHVAEKAIRIQGSPVVQLRVNGKIVGNINPAFRAGNFRS